MRNTFATAALLLAAPLVLGPLTGCSETGITADVEVPTDRPIISVYPEALVFGEATSGEELIKEFQVTNEGTSTLDVSSMWVRGNEESFRMVDRTALSLQPGESAIVKVAFSPMRANEVVGSVDITSDDSITGTVEVPLRGVGLVPELVIDPWTHDFGRALIGCEESQPLTLSNVGSEDLVVDDILYEGIDGTMNMVRVPSLPLTLEPGGSTTLDVTYTPTDEVQSDGVLTVFSNDPRGEVDADQVGDAVYDDLIEDNFEMPVAPPVDILFAIDQSCSMQDDASRLASNFSGFIDQIDSVTKGWRVGVATRDDGCFNTGILERTTPSYKSRFSSGVLTWNGGSYTESLLTVAKNAMGQSRSGCNSGFLRPDAATHIILVSDEPEQSRASWSSLVSDLRGLHPTDGRLVKISAVAGDYPSGCGTAMAGDGYYQAVNETGGEFLSICDTNWARHVDRLANASVEGLGRFDLSQTPDERTLEVWVDSVLWTDGWHMEGSTLVFDETPPEGARVDVTYHNLACQ